MAEPCWEWGNYDWFLIDGLKTAYVTIRALRPDLIVLVMPMTGHNGCHLMSALRLDNETAGIPIMIYMAEPEDRDFELSRDDELPFRIN